MPVQTRQPCEHKHACRSGYSAVTRERMGDQPCPREVEGTVGVCPALVPMACGHPRVYLRWSPVLGDDIKDCWCAKCEEEAGQTSRTGYPARCVIVDAAGTEIAPGLIAATPNVSRQHIGKNGTAELIDDWTVRITLDDGTVLRGWECWWQRIDEEASDECK